MLQRLTLDHGSDQFALIHHDDVTSAHARLGVRVARTWGLDDDRAVTTWLRANLWQTFGGHAGTTFTNLQGRYPVSFNADAAGGSGWTRAEVGAGITGRITRNVGLFAAGTYSHALEDGGGHGVGGRLGVTISW